MDFQDRTSALVMAPVLWVIKVANSYDFSFRKNTCIIEYTLKLCLFQSYLLTYILFSFQFFYIRLTKSHVTPSFRTVKSISMTSTSDTLFKHVSMSLLYFHLSPVLTADLTNNFKCEFYSMYVGMSLSCK
jgi:hypothetical protein